jgi:GT2 family glycosyltransferase
VENQASEHGARAHDRPEADLDDLTVVIVDWNLPDHTTRCAGALISDGVPPSRIVVVENGPTDLNWIQIRRELTGCTLVRIEENVGFAAANNIGAAALPGRAYLLVNNDAFVHRPGTVRTLLRSLRGNVGIAVPRLLNQDLSLQPSVVPFMTPLPALIRASGASRFVPNRWQPRASTHWDHASSREIEAAIGAVVLVHGRAWDELGGLDEASFMYAEDLDLFWRARQNGWKAWFASDACFLHLKGTSSDLRWNARERGERIALAEAAMIRGHLSRPRAETTLAFMRLGLAARVLCFTLTRNTAAADSCRGSLRGLKKGQRGTARSRHRPAIEVVPAPVDTASANGTPI